MIGPERETMKSRILHCFLAALLPTLAIGVEVGDTREQLIREKGAPISAAEGWARSILTFTDRTTVTVVEGRVTQVTQPSQATVRAARLKSFRATNDRSRFVMAIGITVLAGLFSFRLFFSSGRDFVEAIRFYFQPDLISAFRGEWMEDKWASAKLFVWLAISVVAGVYGYGFLGGSWEGALEFLRR